MTAIAGRAASSAFPWPRERCDILAVLLLLSVAWFVYPPTAPGFLDYVDFPENILAMRSGETFTARFTALASAQARAGRWSPVNVALLAGQWSLFGWHSIGWRLVRFSILTAVVLLAYALFRRLQLSPSGSAVSASLLLISPAAVMGWTRLSTVEPVGMLFLLAGSHAALRPQSPRARWVVALLLLAMIWSKELMLAAWLLPVVLSLAAVERMPRFTWQSTRLALGPSMVVLPLGVVPIAWTYLHASSDAFAREYAASPASSANIIGAFVTAAIPFSPGRGGGDPSPIVPVGALLLLLCAGWAATFRRTNSVVNTKLILAIGIILPLVGALAYAPWPEYLLVYALPFVVGGSLLVGQAADSLLSLGGTNRALTTVGLAIILSFALAQASSAASKTRAVIDAVAMTVPRVASAPEIDTTLVAVAPNQFDPTGNFGPRFVTYAWARGLDWPVTRDIRCDKMQPSVPKGTMVVLLSEMCHANGMNPPDIVVYHRRFRWPDPRGIPDSVTVTFLSARTK